MRRAELLVLIEDTWAEMAASSTMFDETYARLVRTCESEGTPLPETAVSGRRNHLEARRELIATCRASQNSVGVEHDLSWLTGDHDCKRIPLPSS